MAANILNSARAVQNEYDVRGRRWIDGIARLGSGRAIGRTRVNIFVVRAFAKMRESLRAAPDLARKLANLEKKLTGRLDVHEAAIVAVFARANEDLESSAWTTSAAEERDRL